MKSPKDMSTLELDLKIYELELEREGKESKLLSRLKNERARRDRAFKLATKPRNTRSPWREEV